ncbi:hypothetical protein [Roseiconus lacunae]|uniref:hypothetical protein n=1 Tax=Roseiconus lacunae TaxID=2605694 RepID=UPI00135A84CC|nr:hypothetical protein [Roseiconus lacunae]
MIYNDRVRYVLQEKHPSTVCGRVVDDDGLLEANDIEDNEDSAVLSASFQFKLG